MDRSSALVMGSDVTCEDGTGGELSGLVVDATSSRLTAIVVGGAVEPARVVPFDLISGLRGNHTEISCTSAAVEGLEPAEPAKVLDAADDPDDGAPVSLVSESDASPEAVLRPREQVLASDGAVGRVHGCRIDAEKYPGHLTALLVDVGRAGEERVVEVPARGITSMKGIVALDISRQDARDLPAAEL